MGTQDVRAQAPASPKLLDRVRDAIRMRHYSYRTEETYVHWIKRFIYFHGKRHPNEMGEAEVTAFLNHLSRERKVAGIDAESSAFGDPVSIQRRARPAAGLAGRAGMGSTARTCARPY